MSGGGGSDGKDTLTSSELRDTEGHRDAGTVREMWTVWMERQGGRQGRRGNGQARDRDVRYSGAPEVPDRSYCPRMQRCQERGHPFHAPTLHQPCSHPFLGRWGQPRCQVAGQAPPAPSGICLRSTCPCPKAAYLPPGNRVADGTWGAQVAGPGQRCELCAVKNGVGVGGATHLGGRNLNLPEAAGASGSASQAAVGTPWHHRTQPAQAGGQRPAGNDQAPAVCAARQTPRLQTELG